MTTATVLQNLFVTHAAAFHPFSIISTTVQDDAVELTLSTPLDEGTTTEMISYGMLCEKTSALTMSTKVSFAYSDSNLENVLCTLLGIQQTAFDENSFSQFYLESVSTIEQKVTVVVFCRQLLPTVTNLEDTPGFKAFFEQVIGLYVHDLGMTINSLVKYLDEDTVDDDDTDEDDETTQPVIN